MSGALKGGSWPSHPQRGARGERISTPPLERAKVLLLTRARQANLEAASQKKNGRLPIRGVPPAARVCPAPPGLALSGALLPPPPSYPVSRAHLPRLAETAPAEKKGSKVKMYPMTPTRGGSPTKWTNVYGPQMHWVGRVGGYFTFFQKKLKIKRDGTYPFLHFVQCLRASCVPLVWWLDLPSRSPPCGVSFHLSMLHSPLSRPRAGHSSPAGRRGARPQRKEKCPKKKSRS